MIARPRLSLGRVLSGVGLSGGPTRKLCQPVLAMANPRVKSSMKANQMLLLSIWNRIRVVCKPNGVPVKMPLAMYSPFSSEHMMTFATWSKGASIVGWVINRLARRRAGSIAVYAASDKGTRFSPGRLLSSQFLKLSQWNRGWTGLSRSPSGDVEAAGPHAVSKKSSSAARRASLVLGIAE
jgi:hypothetical protein